MRSLITVSFSVALLAFSSPAAADSQVCAAVMPNAAALISNGDVLVSFTGSGFTDVRGKPCFEASGRALMRNACVELLADDTVTILPVVDPVEPEPPVVDPQPPVVDPPPSFDHDQSCHVEQKAIAKLARKVRVLRHKLRARQHG